MTNADRLTMLTRLGFAARGLLYLVIATLIISKGRMEDPAGALGYIGQGGGQPLLILMTLGLIAYGLWRLSDAAFNIERHGSGRSDVAERLGAAGSGLIHFFLAWQAVRLMRDYGAKSGASAQGGAQSMLQLPVGGLLLIVGGMVLLAVGVFQLIKASKGSYLDSLEPAIARQQWAQWSGRLGYAARGLAFLIAAFFFVSAGLDEKASEAGGMAEALSWLNRPGTSSWLPACLRSACSALSKRVLRSFTTFQPEPFDSHPWPEPRSTAADPANSSHRSKQWSGTIESRPAAYRFCCAGIDVRGGATFLPKKDLGGRPSRS